MCTHDSRHTGEIKRDPAPVRSSLRRRSVAGQSASARPVCQVCQEETRPADGTFCTADSEPSAHFVRVRVCGACLVGHVTTELEKLGDAGRLRAHRNTGGRIRCVCFGGGRSACTGSESESYTDKSLALHVNDEPFEQYRAKQDEVVEQRHWEAAQAMIAAKARAA
jgi:hypothetical protein